jgi:hypothetical protein
MSPGTPLLTYENTRLPRRLDCATLDGGNRDELDDEFLRGRSLTRPPKEVLDVAAGGEPDW